MELETKLSDTEEQNSNDTQISPDQSYPKEQFDLELSNREEESIEIVKVPVTAVGAEFEKLSAVQLETEELKPLAMTISSDIHSVPIAEGTNAENVLYRIKRGTTLRVHGDATLLGREIILYTNYPAEGR